MAQQDGPGSGRTNQGRFVKGVSGNPSGVRKVERNDQAPAPVGPVAHQDLQGRTDGWVGGQTGFGNPRFDKRLNHFFVPTSLSYRQAMDLWQGDDLAARAIETVPAECFREGYELNIASEEDYSELKEEVETAISELGVNDAVEQAFKFERAYGGGAVMLGVNDGQTHDLPLNEERVISFDYVTPLEPMELAPFAWYGDATKPKYGLPSHYMLSLHKRGVSMTPGEKPLENGLIHESRLAIFPGIRVSKYQEANSSVGDWGTSVLQRFVDVLRDFENAFTSAGILVTDFSQAVIAIENYAKFAAENRGQNIRDRLMGIELGRSTARAILLDKNETYSRQSTSVAGLSDLLDRLASRLAAAIEMPLTLLMGQSPKGLGNEGDSDIRFFYDRIAAVQKRKLKPILRRIVKLLLRAEKRKEPDKWDLKFHPLWQLSDLERVQSRLAQAQIDQIYTVGIGVTTPEEIRQARFTGEYSFETQVEDATESDETAKLTPEELAAMGRAPGTAPTVPSTPGAPAPTIDPVTGQPVEAPAPDAPTVTPEGTPGGAAGDTIQSQVLNGAQVSSLVDVVKAAALNEIPRDSAIKIIELAYQLSVEQATEILGDVGNGFEPTPPAPKGGGFPPRGGGGGPAPAPAPAPAPGGGGAPPSSDGGSPPTAQSKTDGDEPVRLVDVARAWAEMMEVEATYRLDFDEDQPRAENGQWGEGGASGTSESKPSGGVDIKAVMRDADLKEAAKAAKAGKHSAAQALYAKHGVDYKPGEKPAKAKAVEAPKAKAVKAPKVPKVPKAPAKAKAVKAPKKVKQTKAKTEELKVKAGKSGSEMAKAEYDEHAKEVASKLDETETKAVEAYTRTDYLGLNETLRKQSGDLNGLDSEAITIKREKIAALDKVLEKSEIPRDTVVYRGLNTSQKFVPGTVIQDHAFVSTSASQKVAESFGSTTMKIAVRQGQKGLAAEAITGIKGEREVLLPRGSKFRILRVEGNTVHAEVVD